MQSTILYKGGTGMLVDAPVYLYNLANVVDLPKGEMMVWIMGYRGYGGLGKTNEGRMEPLEPVGNPDTMGLGYGDFTEEPNETEDGSDASEVETLGERLAKVTLRGHLIKFVRSKEEKPNTKNATLDDKKVS